MSTNVVSKNLPIMFDNNVLNLSIRPLSERSSINKKLFCQNYLPRKSGVTQFFGKIKSIKY